MVGKGVAAQQPVASQQDAFDRTESFDGAECKAGAGGMKNTGGQVLAGDTFLVDANPDQGGGLEKIRHLFRHLRVSGLFDGFFPIVGPLGAIPGTCRNDATD